MPPKEDGKPTFLTRKQLAFENGTAFGLSVTIKGLAASDVEIRGFTKEGPFTFRNRIVTTGVAQTAVFRIPDIPTLISVVDLTGSQSQGDCYVDLNLTVNGTKSFALCSGWVYKTKSISYPATSNADYIPTRGKIVNISAPANPAAGAEFNFVLPSGYKYKILAVSCFLTTSAAVATRRAKFILTINGETQYYMFSLIDQVASLQRHYRGAIQASQTVVAGNKIGFQIPDEMWTDGGESFQSETEGIQAADQWSTLMLTVERFIGA